MIAIVSASSTSFQHQLLIDKSANRHQNETPSCAVNSFSRFVRDVIRAAAIAALSAVPLVAQLKQSTLVTTPVMPNTRVEAGVKVLQHDRTAFARATQLELAGAPLTVIGGADGDVEHDLTWAQYVAVLSDGRVATLAAVGNKYYVFGADGQYQRTLGRQGKGPGEFTRPSGNILLAGDTLLIADDANLQFSWFHPDKGFVRARARGVEGRLRMEHVVGALPAGRVVLSAAGLVQAGELNKIVRPAAPVSILSFERGVHSLVELPDLELVKFNVTRRGQSRPETRIRRFTTQAVVAVWDSSVVTGTGDRYEFDVRNAAGAVTSRIAVSTPRIAVTRDMRAASIDRTMRRYRNSKGEGGLTLNLDEIEKIERDTPVADSLPAYGQFFTTPNKTLWVVDAVAPNATEWTATAFRNDGAIVGRLHVLGEGVPLAFGNDRVVIRTEDADGVVTLTVRQIGVTTAKKP